MNSMKAWLGLLGITISIFGVMSNLDIVMYVGGIITGFSLSGATE